MLSQGQFFDAQAYRVRPTPAQNAERQAQLPASPTENAMEYLRAGRMPVEGSDARQARKLLNSTRHAMGGETARERAFRSGRVTRVPTEAFGVPKQEGFYDSEPTWLPERNSTHEWRKLGKVSEVPYNRIASAQGSVSQERVDELHRLPGTGTDPRFAGAALQELPVAVKVPTSIGDVAILHNGNHRVMANMSKHQPELFHQMRTVNAPTNMGDMAEMATGLADYRAERQARTGIEPKVRERYPESNVSADVFGGGSGYSSDYRNARLDSDE